MGVDGQRTLERHTSATINKHSVGGSLRAQVLVDHASDVSSTAGVQLVTVARSGNQPKHLELPITNQPSLMGTDRWKAGSASADQSIIDRCAAMGRGRLASVSAACTRDSLMLQLQPHAQIPGRPVSGTCTCKHTSACVRMRTSRACSCACMPSQWANVLIATSRFVCPWRAQTMVE